MYPAISKFCDSRNFCHFMSSFAVMVESVAACVKLVRIVIFGFYFNA